MNTRTIGLSLLSSAVVGLVTVQASVAGFSIGNSVTMGGSSIFQIMGSADGVAPEHRAWQTQDALDNALVLAQNKSPSAVAVSRENGAITVVLDGRRVATADANSASLEHMSVDDLAQKWAESIKGFLSDQDRTATYVATLVREQQVRASVMLTERTMFVPAGFSFPITLTTALASDTVTIGDRIEATVNRDAPLGSYAIASGSVLIGEIIEGHNHDFGIHFSSMRSPNGTIVAIDATVLDDHSVGIAGPHLVATQVIPAGSAIGVLGVDCRVPAGIGVGTVSEGERHLFAFRRDSGLIAMGRPLNVVFGVVTPVAVIMRDMF